MTRCSHLAKLLAVAVFSFTGATVFAAGYPDHSIKIIMPYAPGGGTDILTRMMAPEVGRILGQSIIIENHPGSSTILGTSMVLRAPQDGYTFLAADSVLVINPGLYKERLPYDTLKSLQGVTMMATAPVILLMNPKVPAKNLKELIALAKSEPGKLNFGSGGTGAGTHLAGELLKLRAGIDMVHVPYNGTSPGVNAVMAGDVQLMFGGISSARQLVESGRLIGLAVTTDKRNPALPNVPTFKEYGLNIDANTYWGLYAAAGVPKPIVEKFSQAFATALHDPANQQKLADLGYLPIGNTPAQHTQQMHEMVKLWIDVIDKAHIKVDQP
jgi:tripartite-type tricarboxylate transporter receptor subunit TctC